MKLSNVKTFSRQGLVGACSLFAMIGAMPAFADNPAVSAINYDVVDETAKAPDISLTTLDVDVTLAGGYALTQIVGAFVTDASGRIEGDFLLDMPEGAIITGYALDVNGTLIDGVLLEKAQAKKAFEDRIREGIDPGLAEATSTNAFKTRVFPFTAGVPRTISLSFVAPVSPTMPYSLPLETDSALEAFSLNVTNTDGPERPDITLPTGEELIWTTGRQGADGQSASGALKLEDTILSGTLEITPQTMPRSVIETGPLGDRFLSLAVPVDAGSKALRKPQTIEIIWDTSLSHENTAEAEQAFLARVLETYPDADYSLTAFNTDTDVIGRVDAEDIAARIDALSYNGATDLHGMFADYVDAGKRSDLCLVFTDGRSTMGEGALEGLPCATYMVSAAADANRSSLSHIGQQGGGGFIDLAFDNIEAGLAVLARQTPRLESLRIDRKEVSDGVVWRYHGDYVRVIAPIASRARRASLRVDGQTIRIDLAASTLSPGGIVSDSWAHQYMAGLRANGTDRDTLVKIAKDYGVASDETSFLVLENVSDYVENELPLPETGFDKTAHQNYEDMVLAKAARDKAAREGRREHVLGEWNAVKAWYDTDFTIKYDAKQEEPRERPENATGDVPPPPPPPPPPAGVQSALDAEEGELDQIVVTATRRERAETSAVSPVTSIDSEALGKTIEIKPWTPDRPYLSDVADLPVEAFLEGYIAQRAEFGSVPSFYLEMSDAASRAKGEVDKGRALARDIALSALELESANNDTLTAVAQRLVTLGYYEDAIWLYTKLTKLESFRPQPWRNLALALAGQADHETSRRKKRDLYTQALTHLNHVIETPWGEWAQGIEVISIMEANNILRKFKSVGGKTELIHKSFRQLLDVDLRVAVSWNIDAADMDLHVDEPSGQTASYRNRLTNIGGRMSNDMTNGYGPEEYILRKAAPGKYEIKMDYYSSDRANPNGAIVIRANIYRNWGREDEVVKTIDLEFTKDTGEQYLVATVEVD